MELSEKVFIFRWMISDLQCEYIQGYYYSRPVPKNEFVRFIEENMV